MGSLGKIGQHHLLIADPIRIKQRCSTLLRSNERSVLRSFKMLFEIHSGLKNRWIIDDEKDKNIYDRVVGADSRFSAGQYFGFPRQSVHPGGSKRTAAGNCPDDSARSPQPPACNGTCEYGGENQ